MDKLMKNCPCSNTTTQYFFHVLNNHINERLTFWAVTLADSEAYLFFLQSNSCLVSVRIVSFRQEIQISIKIRKMTDVKESNCNIIKTPFDPLIDQSKATQSHSLYIIWTLSAACGGVEAGAGRRVLWRHRTTSCCCSPWAWPLVRWHPLPLIGQKLSSLIGQAALSGYQAASTFWFRPVTASERSELLQSQWDPSPGPDPQAVWVYAELSGRVSTTPSTAESERHLTDDHSEAFIMTNHRVPHLPPPASDWLCQTTFFLGLIVNIM